MWGYTHAWRTVPREDWRGVSVLASVESHKDVEAAAERGYASLRVVRGAMMDHGHAYRYGPFRYIPCPEITRGVKCTDCRLCLDADGLHRRKSVILVSPVGNWQHAVEKRLAL